MDVNVLLSREVCSRKADFYSLNLKKGKDSKKIYDAITQVLVKRNRNYKEDLKKVIDEEEFLLIRQKELYQKNLFVQIDRYLDFQFSRSFDVLGMDLFSSCTFNEVEVKSKVDLILQYDNTVELIKFKFSEPELSYKARKIENKPFYSLELYFLWLVGKELFEGREIRAAFYHLKSKDDTSSELASEFEAKPGKNIISVNFDEEEYSPEERVIKLLDGAETQCSDESCEKCSYKSICSIDRYTTSGKMVEKEELLIPLKPKFNQEQREAIYSQQPFIQIIACAGAGKTTTLAARVSELISRGRKEEEILLITFTNEAVKEMRDKVKRLNPMINADKINIFTFNGYGMFLIGKYFRKLGYQKRPKLISKVEQIDIILELLNNKDYSDYLNVKEPLANFSNYKGAVLQALEIFEQISKGKMDSSEEDDYYNAMSELYLDYLACLKQKNLIDYGQQIQQAIQICSTLRKGVLKYTDIMIDEGQDTNDAQLELTLQTYINCNPKTLLICGDDDQTVYTFQGAKAENLINLETNFVYRTPMGIWGLQRLILDKNYRSTAQILDLAHNIISKNEQRIEKRLVSGFNKQGAIPLLVPFDTKEEEYKYIIESLQMEKEQVAVITRTNKELNVIAELLRNNSIPFTHIKSQSFLENKYVNAMISYAKAMYDIENTIAVAELSYFFMHQVTTNTLEVCTNSISKKGSSIECFMKIAKQLSLDVVSEQFVEYIKEKGFKTLEQLVIYLGKMIRYEEKIKVEVPEDKTNNIILITAHQSKGKEFESVYLVVDKFATTDVREVEEERRLGFVAATRAKQNLHLFYSNNKSKRNKFKLVDEVLEFHSTILNINLPLAAVNKI